MGWPELGSHQLPIPSYDPLLYKLTGNKNGDILASHSHNTNWDSCPTCNRNSQFPQTTSDNTQEQKLSIIQPTVECRRGLERELQPYNCNNCFPQNSQGDDNELGTEKNNPVQNQFLFQLGWVHLRPFVHTGILVYTSKQSKNTSKACKKNGYCCCCCCWENEHLPWASTGLTVTTHKGFMKLSC